MTATSFTFTMSRAQAERIHNLAAGAIGAHKNWLLSAVEREDLLGAQELAVEIRRLQALFAAFNMPAKDTIACARGRTIETDIHVEETSR